MDGVKLNFKMRFIVVFINQFLGRNTSINQLLALKNHLTVHTTNERISEVIRNEDFTNYYPHAILPRIFF